MQQKTNYILKIVLQESIYLLIINLMDSEILKWIEQAPKSLRLSGSKKSFYNGEEQLKLFFEIVKAN